MKEVDVKARLRHGSVMLVYPSQEPAGEKETLAMMLIKWLFQPLLEDFLQCLLVCKLILSIPGGKTQETGMIRKPKKRRISGEL